MRSQGRATLAIFALLLVLPWAVPQPYWQGVFTVALYYALLAAAWNLLAGYGGQFSLAPAAFSLLGGYTTGVLHYHLHLGPQVGIPAAIVLTFLVGVLLGWIVLRMRGPYLALTTFAFLAIVQLIIANSYTITRGDLGLSVPGLPLSPVGYYYVFLLALGLVQLATALLLRSRVGLFIQAIRDDEVAASARGVDVVRWKTLAFAVSSAMSGCAGALYVHYSRLASPEMGTVLESGLVISMTVIGGLGTLPGPLLGAFLVEVGAEALRLIGVRHMLVFSAVMILVARTFREGLWGAVERLASPSRAVPAPQETP